MCDKKLIGEAQINMAAEQTAKKNLIISPVGDDSCHESWLKSGKRDFDLMLVYYGNSKDKFKKDADYYVQNSGLFKLESIALAADCFRDAIATYDAICLPDSDIIADTSTFNRLFKIFHDYDLDIAQPSIAGGCYWHSIAIQRDECILRYSNFIEMMCPVFNREAFFKVLPLFSLNRSGWGVDFLWSKIFASKKMAIIDATGVYHKSFSRRLTLWAGNTQYYVALEKNGINPKEELLRIVEKYTLKTRDKDIKELASIKKPRTLRRMFFPKVTLLKLKHKCRRICYFFGKLFKKLGY